MSTASHIYRMETYQEAGKVPALAAFETAVRPTPILSVIRVSKTMTFLEKQRVARTNDMSKEAVCARFRAAVAAAGYKRQKDFAEALGTRGVSSISNVYKEM